MKKKTQKIVVWSLLIIMILGTIATFAVYFIK